MGKKSTKKTRFECYVTRGGTWRRKFTYLETLVRYLQVPPHPEVYFVHRGDKIMNGAEFLKEYRRGKINP